MRIKLCISQNVEHFLESFIYRILQSEKTQSYLKVEVKGRHHVCIVRKALQGLRSVGILNISENLATEQAHKQHDCNQT